MTKTKKVIDIQLRGIHLTVIEDYTKNEFRLYERIFDYNTYGYISEKQHLITKDTYLHFIMKEIDSMLYNITSTHR